jgi:TolB protein
VYIGRMLGATAALAVLASCSGTTLAHDIVWARGTPARLWHMPANGAAPTSVFADTLLRGQAANFPDVSPDGTRVAFVATSERGTSVYVASIDGSGVEDLTPVTLDHAQWPAWSPDGTEIVFNGGPSAVEQDLFLMKADGSGVRRLTAGESMDYCPRWSPDGQKLVFSSVVADTFRLMTWDRTEGTVSELLPRGFEAECGDWSPDGSRIAFSSTPDHDYPSLEGMASWTPRMSIYVLDVATRAITQLTDLAGTSARPRWSPDGHQILFHSTESIGTVPFSQLGTAYELYVIEADGSDIRRLTRNDMYDAHPAWQGR